MRVEEPQRAWAQHWVRFENSNARLGSGLKQDATRFPLAWRVDETEFRRRRHCKIDSSYA
jgi:hypothetical protein